MDKYDMLMTEAGEKIKGREDVWQEYPRPQMKRSKWLNLNGIWELEGKPVRVPFPPESVLAEYEGEIKEHMTNLRGGIQVNPDDHLLEYCIGLERKSKK